MEPSEVVVFLVIGLASGWIANRIVTGRGRSLLSSLVVGVIGAFVGAFLLQALDLQAPAGILGSMVTAVIGAGALLIVAGAVGSLTLVLIGALVLLFVLGGISFSMNV